MEDRKIKQILESKPTIEGAGVHLKRVFGHNEIPLFDPFLLFDDFSSDDRKDYSRGFPWHPHRGIETITYLLAGKIRHRDSIGSNGVLGAGDVQWMTAGSGIIHEEMPEGDSNDRMHGFQLWLNLPASKKMISPNYREINHSIIPKVLLDNGIEISIICGKINNIEGPISDDITNPVFFDIKLPSNTIFTHPTVRGKNVFIYIIEGKGFVNEISKKMVQNNELVLFDDGDQITIYTEKMPMRLLYLSGNPLNETIAWGGPIVMNTHHELRIAFDDYEKGTFVK